MHLQAVASTFLIVFLCQHEVLVSALFGTNLQRPVLNPGLLTNQGPQQGQAVLQEFTTKIADVLHGQGKSTADAKPISETIVCTANVIPNAVIPNAEPSKKADEMRKLLSEASNFYNTNRDNITPSLLGGLGNTVNNLGNTVNSLLTNQAPQQGQAVLQQLTTDVSNLLHGQGKSTANAKPISELLQCVKNNSHPKTTVEMANLLSTSSNFMEQNKGYLDNVVISLGNTINSLGNTVHTALTNQAPQQGLLLG